MQNRLGVRASLLLGVAVVPAGVMPRRPVPARRPLPTPRLRSRARPSERQAPTSRLVAGTASDLDEIVVTGQTTRNRKLITASADITFATAADIDRKAPRSVADLLELVPGIFVEATAGEVSNNYSVRGLQGGGQRFVQLEEDGLPIVYGGGGGRRILLRRPDHRPARGCQGWIVGRA